MLLRFLADRKCKRRVDHATGAVQEGADQCSQGTAVDFLKSITVTVKSPHTLRDIDTEHIIQINVFLPWLLWAVIV